MLALTAARVAVVSGKGGVGKTTVAAALALAAARGGRRVLLAEVEDRDSFSGLFGVPEVGFTDVALAPGLTGISIVADEALVEYLRLMYRIPTVSRALVRSKVVEFATNTAPGLRDILLIGKVMESERRRRGGRFAYDLVVVDGPPTGRLPRFLDAPRAIAELVRAGPIRSQAQMVLDMVIDPARLQVVPVTQPEEMPVRETTETIERLRKADVAIGPVVVNGLWRELPGLGRDAGTKLRTEAAAASIVLADPAIERLAAVATTHARRARNQRRALKDLDTSRRRVELPFLFTERLARDEITELAARIEGSGLL